MEAHAAGITTTGLGTASGLAYTGLNTIAYLVAALTLIFAGLALLKIVPRRSR